MPSIAVRSRPITFVTPLVRAILAGQKTQTRRLIKPAPDCVGQTNDAEPVAFCQGRTIHCPFGKAGDTLWGRERWAERAAVKSLYPDGGSPIVYAADPEADQMLVRGWKPARFMPRRHARLTLQVERVRVERLTHVSEADARAEGCPAQSDRSPIEWFRGVWDELSDETSNWLADPLVWVVQFHVINADK